MLSGNADPTLFTGNRCAHTNTGIKSIKTANPQNCIILLFATDIPLSIATDPHRVITIFFIIYGLIKSTPLASVLKEQSRKAGEINNQASIYCGEKFQASEIKGISL